MVSNSVFQTETLYLDRYGGEFWPWHPGEEVVLYLEGQSAEKIPPEKSHLDIA